MAMTKAQHALKCKEWRDRNKGKIKEYQKQYCRKNKEAVNKNKRRWRRENKGTYNAQRRRNKKQIKIACFEAYGGCFCKRCDESDLDILCLDHISHNGSEDKRNRVKNRKWYKGGGHMLYRMLKQEKYPPGYQVLCANCNLKKHMEYLRGLRDE